MSPDRSYFATTKESVRISSFCWGVNKFKDTYKDRVRGQGHREREGGQISQSADASSYILLKHKAAWHPWSPIILLEGKKTWNCLLIFCLYILKIIQTTFCTAGYNKDKSLVVNSKKKLNDMNK